MFMFESSKYIDFLKYTLDISFLLFNACFFNRFKSIFSLGLRVTSPMALMHFSEVTTAQETTDEELFLNIKKNARTLELFDPFFLNLLIFSVKLEAQSFLHQNEAKKLDLVIFDVSLFESSVFYFKDTSFHIILFVPKLNDSMFIIHEVSLFEVGLIITHFFRCMFGRDIDIVQIMA